MCKLGNKHLNKLFLTLFILLLLGIFITNLISINKKYPDRVEEFFSIGDTFTYNNMQITVTECSLYESAEFESQILKGNRNSLWGNDLGPWKELLLKIHLENNNDDRCQFDCSSLLMQSDSWWNGLDSLTFMELNNLDSLQLQIDPQSDCWLYFPFTLLKIQFKTKDWDCLMDRDYELVGSVYPITQIVRLKADS